LPSAEGALLPDFGQWENFVTARQAVFAKFPTETSRWALPGMRRRAANAKLAALPGAAFEKESKHERDHHDYPPRHLVAAP
jgi:hypothetical protein